MKTRTRAFRFKMSITYAGTFIVILRYVNFRPLYHAQAEFREAKYFPVDIFRIPNSLFDSVRDDESRDIKSLAKFPGDQILEILIQKQNCVGSTEVRRRFLMKMCPICFNNCPVILRCFLGQVYLILTEPTQISTPVNPIKHVIAFSHNVSQRRDIDHSMWNFMGNLRIHST